MTIFAKGGYRAVEARGGAGLDRALALRVQSFPADREGGDEWDRACRHIVVEDAATAEAVATFRLMILSHGRDLGRSYAAASYDLAPFADATGPLVEVGRFCSRAGRRDPDILRFAWATLARIVDAAEARTLFGCTSLPGSDWRAHGAVLAHLHDRHLAPPDQRPGIKAPRTVPLARARAWAASARGAPAAMPPLLRTYLALGARVSDHAVIDESMDTIHVFTAVEVAAIPPARRRFLRAAAQ